MGTNVSSLLDTLKNKGEERKTLYIFLLAVFVVILSFIGYGAMIAGEFLIDNAKKQPYSRGGGPCRKVGGTFP